MEHTNDIVIEMSREELEKSYLDYQKFKEDRKIEKDHSFHMCILASYVGLAAGLFLTKTVFWDFLNIIGYVFFGFITATIAYVSEKVFKELYPNINNDLRLIILIFAIYAIAGFIHG